MSTTITYNINDLKKLNKYVLRTIPNSDKYLKLNKFVNDEDKTNLSNVIKRPVIPTYLKDKYGDTKQNINFISRGNYKDQREMTRRKLYSNQNNTIADKINEEIRGILSKLSETNKAKLFNDFKKLDIIDDCGQTLIDNIYLFSVDLDYLVHIYAELILLLKEKNLFLYEQLIQKILEIVLHPLNFNNEENGISKTKRWRMANIKLISAIYQQNPIEIDFHMVKNIIEFLHNQVTAAQPDSLEVLCELLKTSASQLMNEDKDFIDQLIDQLEPLCQNKEYDLRYRFMVQDLIERYTYDSEDD